MGRIWCTTDPIVEIDGETYSIDLAYQAAHTPKIAGPALIRYLIPQGMSFHLVSNAGDPQDPTHDPAAFGGYGIEVEFLIVDPVSPPVAVVTCPSRAGNINLLADVSWIDEDGHGASAQFMGHSSGFVIPITEIL